MPLQLGRVLAGVLVCIALAACELLPGYSSGPSAVPTLVAPEVEGGSLTPEPTIGAGASDHDAPDADAGMPTPEPTIGAGASNHDAPDADAGMPTPEPTIGPSS